MRISEIGILDLERLRAADPSLGGKLPPTATFSTWLRAAARHGWISEGRYGFCLTDAQRAVWRQLGVEIR